MTNKTMNVKVQNETKVENNTTTGLRFRTPDGLIFTSREEYLDYMEGCK